MIIRKISHFLCNYENIVPLFAGACALIFLCGDSPAAPQLRTEPACIPKPLTVTARLTRTIVADLLSHR